MSLGVLMVTLVLIVVLSRLPNGTVSALTALITLTLFILVLGAIC